MKKSIKQNKEEHSDSISDVYNALDDISHESGAFSSSEDSGSEERQDVRSLGELGAVRSLQAITYGYYLNKISIEAFDAIVEAVEFYVENESKPPNVKALKQISDGLKLLYEEKVSMEEARMLLEKSNVVSNEYFEKIQILVSKVGAKAVVVDIESDEIIFSDRIEVQDFVERLAANDRKGDHPGYPSYFAANFKAMTQNCLKASKGLSLFARMTGHALPLNALIEKGERMEIYKACTDVASKMTANDPGLYSTPAFVTKVVTETPNHNMMYMSPQIIRNISDDLLCAKYPIVQMTKDMTVPSTEILFEPESYENVNEMDGTETVVFSRSGEEVPINTFGVSKTHRIVPYSIESSRLPEDQKEELAAERAKIVEYDADQFATRGISRGTYKGDRVAFLSTRWNKKLSEDELAAASTIGWVDKPTYDKYVAFIKKGKPIGGKDAKKVLQTLTWTLIDPLSRRILVVPKSMLRKNSNLSEGLSRVGVKMSLGLSEILHQLCSAFYLGVLSSDDWENLVSKDFAKCPDVFAKVKNLWAKREYDLFVTRMCTAFNSYRCIATFHPGAKDLSDPDVHEFLQERGFETDYAESDEGDYDDEQWEI